MLILRDTLIAVEDILGRKRRRQWSDDGVPGGSRDQGTARVRKEARRQ